MLQLLLQSILPSPLYNSIIRANHIVIIFFKLKKTSPCNLHHEQVVFTTVPLESSFASIFSFLYRYIKKNLNALLTSFMLLVTLKLTTKFLLVNLSLTWVFPLFCAVYGVILRMTLSCMRCSEPLSWFNAFVIGLICLLISAFFVSLDFNIYIEGFLTAFYLPLAVGVQLGLRDFSNIDLTKFFNDSDSSESEWDNQYDAPWTNAGSHRNLPNRPGKCPVGTPDWLRFIYRNPNKSPIQVAEEWKTATEAQLVSLRREKSISDGIVNSIDRDIAQLNLRKNDPSLSPAERNQIKYNLFILNQELDIAESRKSSLHSAITDKEDKRDELLLWVYRRSNIH